MNEIELAFTLGIAMGAIIYYLIMFGLVYTLISIYNEKMERKFFLKLSEEDLLAYQRLERIRKEL
jgi:hypothetical protein